MPITMLHSPALWRDEIMTVFILILRAQFNKQSQLQRVLCADIGVWWSPTKSLLEANDKRINNTILIPNERLNHQYYSAGRPRSEPEIPLKTIRLLFKNSSNLTLVLCSLDAIHDGSQRAHLLPETTISIVRGATVSKALLLYGLCLLKLLAAEMRNAT